MKDWYSARELAGVRGMPGTVQGVNARAHRENWQWQRRQGAGGGREYSIHSLPPRTQAALHMEAKRKDSKDAKDGKDTIPAKDGQPSWSLYERKPAGVRAEAERRLKIVQAVIQIEQGGILPSPAGGGRAGDGGFRGMTRERAIAAVSAESGVPRRTLFRWLRRVKGVHRSDWLPGLAPAHIGRTATAACSPGAWEVFKADYLRLAAPGMAACYERLKRMAAEKGWTVPSLSALKRRLKRETSVGMRVLARHGEEALDRLYPPLIRAKDHFVAMQAVNVDGHVWDVFVRWPDDPDGKGIVARPAMACWQDLYSGKILAWRVGQTECAELVRLSFGDLVERWGVPEMAWMDNGRAFANKWLTGRMPWRYRFKIKAEEPKGILTQLGVAVHWTHPYRGQSKPIERAFRDFCESIARHPAFEGAYTGNSPLAKPENYASRAIPLAEFLRVLDSEIRAHNARPGRRSLVCRGRSFDQAFDESYKAAPIRKASAEQRRLWLLAAEGVLARKPSGHVHLWGNVYWDECLAPYIGQRLVARFDPERLREPLHLYRLDGHYLGQAECRMAVGFDDVEAGRAHAKTKAALKKKERETLALERKLAASDVAALLPDVPEPDPPAANVIAPLFRKAVPAIFPEGTTGEPETKEDRVERERHDEMLRRASLGLWKDVL